MHSLGFAQGLTRWVHVAAATLRPVAAPARVLGVVVGLAGYFGAHAAGCGCIELLENPALGPS